jgi:hypothetical protein
MNRIYSPKDLPFLCSEKCPLSTSNDLPKCADRFAFESQDVSILIENKPLEKPKKEAPLLDF